MSVRRPLVATTAALAALTLAGCGSPAPAGDADAGAPAAGELIKVVASTDVYGAVASAVGGDRVEVVSIVDAPGLDPHEYEATPADAAEVTDAAIVIGNGGGYDEFVPQLVESAGGEAHLIDVYDLSGFEEAAEAGGAAEEEAHSDEDAEAHSAEEEAAEGEAGHSEEEHAGEEAHGAANEHVWYSLPTMETLADTIATELGEASPDDAATFTANADTFKEQIAGLEEKAAAISTASSGTRVAVTEPLPEYLLTDAGLQDVTPEEFSEAIEEGNDPSAAALADTLALFEADPVQLLIVNSQTQSPVTDQVRAAAEQAGVTVIEMTETLPEGETDYVAWMESQIDALGTALGSSTS